MNWAATARGFDEPAPCLPYLGAASTLEVVEELAPTALGTHNTALARR